METTHRAAAVIAVHPTGGVVAAEPPPRAPDPDPLRGNDAGGRAEMNFPGLCKSWRLRIVDCAGIKVGSAPNGPRVARELHAGNHRERRILHVTAARGASFCLTSSIPFKRAVFTWLRRLLVFFLAHRNLYKSARSSSSRQHAYPGKSALLRRPSWILRDPRIFKYSRLTHFLNCDELLDVQAVKHSPFDSRRT